MAGKYGDIGSYVIGSVQGPGQGFLVLSSDEMNARNIANSVFLSCSNSVLKAIVPKKIYTKFLAYDNSRQQLIAMGEFGKGVRFPSGAGAVDESITSSGSDPENRGPLRGGTLVDQTAYVVGMHRQVYARSDDGSWRRHENGLTPVAKGQVAGYEAIAGYSSAELYAAGWDGELVAFDGASWRSVDSPTNQIIVALAAGADGVVYGCGRKGLVLRGRGDKWDVVVHGDTLDDLWSVVWFQGHAYFASMRALYRLDGDHLVPVDVSPVQAQTFYALSANDQALWSVGPKDVIEFDGKVWRKID